MSAPAANPYHIVPASIVIKVRISMPEDVRDGALPPAQSTAPGHVNVALPPLVTTNVNEQEFPVADGLSNVNV